MNFKTMSPITILALIIAILLLTVGIIYAAGQLISIPTNGTVITAATLTATPATLEWGNITRGTSKNVTLLLTNIGGTDTAALLITNTLPSGLYLEYDNASAILAGQSRNITFTLNATVTAPLGAFSYVVNID